MTIFRGRLATTTALGGLVIGLGAGLTVGQAQAAGFYIQEQSVTGLGRAFAGEAAAGTDASTIFFNPAAMTELESAEINAGVHLLIPRADFENDGSTAGIPGLGFFPVTGDSDNPYSPTPVPNLYVAYPFMDDRLWVGVGVTAPFGLANEYEEDWFGRYDSVETELTTINIGPAIAYKVNDKFSIGGGIDIQYADATLTNKIPAGLPASPATDLNADLQGDDWSYGFNLGATFEPTEELRFGVHYRSAMSHDLEGELLVTTAAGAAVVDTSGAAELNLPDIASFGVAYDATPALTLLGGVTWFGWSNFEEIAVVRGDGVPVVPIEQGYQNTFAFSVGASYELNDQWTFRGGFQYDETPTTDEHRTTRTPDGDRYWLSAGASYEINESFVIDAAFTHIFIDDAEVDVSRTSTGSPIVANVAGTSENSVDIVSIGVRYRF
ncbi:outer membrane protein transport protein [Inquilinus sp. CAU 1745]|uniref:OmpP1/FadL family transporter n=1 Tax=Inquilinus sp. CAU 1745 TaxID=3140369 RepID=UPI00325BC148